MSDEKGIEGQWFRRKYNEAARLTVNLEVMIGNRENHAIVDMVEIRETPTGLLRQCLYLKNDAHPTFHVIQREIEIPSSRMPGPGSGLSLADVSDKASEELAELYSLYVRLIELFLRKYLPGADVNDPSIQHRLLDEQEGTVGLVFDFRRCPTE